MLLFVISLVGVIYVVFSIVNKQEIENNAFNTTKIVAQKINEQVAKELTKVEILAKTLANYGATIQQNSNQNRNILKNLLNLKGYENFIAGGGIWPEPYMLDKTKERTSYFFARDKDSKLVFYDDYNDPKGLGYHHEEWYLPAKFYKKGEVYWSKSYVDPYSYEPMVTVTAPMFKDGVFMGVATIDIMLHGLKNLLRENIEDLGGYGFIVDRNNKFLTYPNKNISKLNNNYITFEELSQNYPSYKELSKLLFCLDNVELNKEDKKIADFLQKQSKQIDKIEAKKIALLIRDNNLITTNNKIETVMIDNDPILHEQCMAISIKQANTHWNLVVVMPIRVILLNSDKIFNNLILVISLLVAIFAIIGYFSVKRGIIRPMALMTKQLDTKTVDLQKLNETLNERVKQEVEKNIQKDKKMLENSRLAQMGELISMIAHQWRQPLNAMAATVGVLEVKIELEDFNLDTKDGQNEQSRYFLKKFERLNSYIQNLTQTIDDFRNFYKPNKTKVSTTYETIVNKALDIIEVSLKNSNIEIVKHYEVKETLQIFENEIMQVVLNILKNAQDNFKEKNTINPKITITIKEKTLTICDNGGGIPKDVITKIFDPYYSTKDEKNGTGLGLYMSKTIVQEHHKGELKVENIDGGVSFSINLNATI